MRTTSSATSSVASGEAPEHIFYDAQLRDSKQRPVAAPHFLPRTRIADTHAHLDMLHHPGLALARAAANAVTFVVSVIDPTEDPRYTLHNLASWQQEAQELLDTWNNEGNEGSKGSKEESGDLGTTKSLKAPEVRLIIGCHPHNASHYDQAVEDELVQALLEDSRVVGIGEIGLDYHYDNSPREIQQKVFRRQIQLAHEHNCTIALHLREAHEEGLRVLKEEGIPAKGALLHCFNLDYTTLEPFLELGCKVAFGGPLTFKKADEVRDAAARAPLDCLVTETDCPFMAPVPVRGSVCEPASVIFTADVLRGLRTEAQPMEQLYLNALHFFA